MYTTKENIEAYLLKEIDPTFDSTIESWIEAIEAHINNITGRTFEADEAASTRLFEGGGKQRLIIDDCIQVTLVEIGDTYGESFETVASDDYTLLPLNTTPKTVVALRRQAWPVGTHRITAKWGYSANVPADITFAATVLVAGIVNEQTKVGNAIKSEKIGNYAVTYSDERGISDYDRAMQILASYKRYWL